MVHMRQERQTIMRLYIIRHADPDYEKNTITAEGHQEARALAGRLAADGLDRIYSSPMQRALDTAEYASARLGLICRIEPWTRELWPELVLAGSPWGDIMSMDVPGEIIRGAKEMPTHQNWQKSPEFVRYHLDDVFRDVANHSDAFLARHGYTREGGRYRCVSANEEKIAVFCHGGLALTWLAHLLEIPVSLCWSGFWLPPSSVTTILFEQRSSRWAVPRCIGLADVSHLFAAGLPVRPRGITANFY